MTGLLFLFTCCLMTGLSLTDDTSVGSIIPAMPFSPTPPPPTPAPKQNTTLGPHNITTPTTNKTTTPTTNKTTTPTIHKTTTPPTNKTTTPTTHKTTTPPTNTTTTPTTHKTTTTTTHKTTTVIPPTTTVSPTAPTNLTLGNYSLVKDNVTCLLAQMELQIRLETPKVNGTFIVQPSLTKAEGDCKGTTANLTLVFKEGFITLLFNKSLANNTVYVDALSFSLSYPFKRAGNGHYKADNKSIHLFAAQIGHSYSCRNQSLYMGEGLHLDVGKGRIQAFNLTHNDFGFPDPCPADQPDYRVAVAVGVTLLVLIVIVLVVYLLGRRKRTDGYQSL